MLASIDLKKEEPALLALSGKYQIPFVTYSADELRRIPLVSAGSDFVKRVTGVDNVCERAAVLSCENGELIQKKCVREAMTAAWSLPGGDPVLSIRQRSRCVAGSSARDAAEKKIVVIKYYTS